MSPLFAMIAIIIAAVAGIGLLAWLITEWVVRRNFGSSDIDADDGASA